MRPLCPKNRVGASVPHSQSTADEVYNQGAVTPAEENNDTSPSLAKAVSKILPSAGFFMLTGALFAWICIAFIIGTLAAWAIPLWVLVTLVPAIMYYRASSGAKFTRRLLVALGWAVVLIALYLIFLFVLSP